MRGEFQMAAWEFGAGPMPHWAATAFCLPLVLAGAVTTPWLTWKAFVAGRQARSLHGHSIGEYMLDMPLTAVRAALSATPDFRKPWAHRVSFALLLIRGTLALLLPLAVLLGLVLLFWSAAPVFRH